MLRVAGFWKRLLAAAMAATFVVAALAASGCSTFSEKSRHSPYSSGRSAGRNAKKHSMNPLSIFKREEPRLAETPSDFVNLPRPEW
jgi:hypothetical protein